MFAAGGACRSSLFLAAGAALLAPLAEALSLSQQPATSRTEVCEVCSRQCSVSCFVGTCGFDYPVGVERFRDSPLCSSCDQAVAASVSGAGAFEICTPVEASMGTGPTIPAGSSDQMQALLAHSVAAQVEAATALQTVQASHQAFLRGAAVYREEMLKLTAAQMRVKAAKQELDRLANQETASKTALAVQSAAAAQATQAISTEAMAESAGGAAGSTDAQSVMAKMQAEMFYKQRLQQESQAATNYKRAVSKTNQAAAAVPKTAMLLSAQPPKVARMPQLNTQGIVMPGSSRPAAVPHLQAVTGAGAPLPVMAVSAAAALGPGVELDTEKGPGGSAGTWFET